MTISLEAVNVDGHFIRHQQFLGELTRIESDLDRNDASFERKKGFTDPNDPNLVSLSSHRNFSSFFLRHKDFRIRLDEAVHTFSGTTPFASTPEAKQFAEDATFAEVPGLSDPTGVSFRSVNFPDRFIRHRDFHLFLEPVNNEQDRRDATFRVGPGFVPSPPPP